MTMSIWMDLVAEMRQALPISAFIACVLNGMNLRI